MFIKHKYDKELNVCVLWDTQDSWMLKIQLFVKIFRAILYNKHCFFCMRKQWVFTCDSQPRHSDYEGNNNSATESLAWKMREIYKFLLPNHWKTHYNKDPRFTGSNPTKGDGFLRVVRIRSTTSVRGEVKPSAPCCKILQHVKDP
jgi:hypothetical protein